MIPSNLYTYKLPSEEEQDAFAALIPQHSSQASAPSSAPAWKQHTADADTASQLPELASTQDCSQQPETGQTDHAESVCNGNEAEANQADSAGDACGPGHAIDKLLGAALMLQDRLSLL